MFLQPVREALELYYAANMPTSQQGGVSGGGTDFAHHVILEMMNYARVHDMCSFVLFIDLVKAYDKVIRELVFGFPLHMLSSRIEYLCSIGVHVDDAAWICDYIDTCGTAFQQFGVPDDLSALINALHSSSWASYSTNPAVFVPGTGGRQGCTLGGVIFNCAYALALRVVQRKLSSEGIVLRLRCKHTPFWRPGVLCR